MRTVLLLFYRAGRPWMDSLRRLCRLIAEQAGVSWRTVAFAVRSLRDMGLVKGPPYRLTPAGTHYAARRFGAERLRAPEDRAPEEECASLPPVLPAPARPAGPAPLPGSPRFQAPSGEWGPEHTSVGPLRCVGCGTMVRLTPIAGTRSARCPVCGREQIG